MRVQQLLTNTRLFAAIVNMLVGIIAAAAVGSSVRAQVSDDAAARLRADNEAAAIARLRAIGVAETRYHQRCTGYAPNLNELIQTHYLPPTTLTAGTITTNGYRTSVEPAGAAIPMENLPSGCIGSTTDFFSHADPITLGVTGTRYYASDARQTIFFDSVPMTYPPPARRSQVAK